MTVKEIRSEIIRVLEELDEQSLKEVLYAVRQVEERSTKSEGISANLTKILTEDKELLKRLAQ